ncbi:MAG TPA: gliding motility-associated C-terminal domain-containing protein, partial [Bacteroidia bacterium]|nr:gliding motility-associated C-terminal domain-containing protein [Bacteroidia bacterium]
ILDRWGLKIFHSKDKKQPWDGTYYENGNQAQSDVYEYVIRVHDMAGKLHRFIGHVTLVR